MFDLCETYVATSPQVTKHHYSNKYKNIATIYSEVIIKTHVNKVLSELEDITDKIIENNIGTGYVKINTLI